MATPEQLLMALDPDGVLDMMDSRKRIKQETQDDDYENHSDIRAKPGHTESIESDSSSDESFEEETNYREGESSDCSNEGSSDEGSSDEGSSDKGSFEDESFDEDQPPINDGEENLYNDDACTIIPKGGSLAKYERKRCGFEGCLKFVQNSKLGVCGEHGGEKVCSHDGCTNWVRNNGSVCQAHGGKKRMCSHEGCTSGARLGGKCYTHAEKRLCSHEECTSEALHGGIKCSTHGEKRRRYCCSEEGCTTFAIVKGGVCIKHGANRKRKQCSHEGCTTQAVNSGLCHHHGGRSKKFCTREGCTNWVVSKGVCIKHGAVVKARKKNCCTREGCTQWAVSKGVCIKHGAVVKVKECSHPLCMKRASKAGLCWIHGDESLRCKHPGCGRVAKHSGLCHTHCDRTLLKRCNYDGCENFILKAGRCWSHQLRPKCTHEGCAHDQQNGGLCPLHWAKKIGHICSVEGCKDKAARGGLCKLHLRTIDVGCQNRNGKEPRTAPKARPISVSKSLVSKFKPLAKEIGEICSTEEQECNASNGPVCPQQPHDAIEDQNHNGKRAGTETASKARQTFFSKTSASEFKPLAKEIEDICSVEEQKGKAAVGEISQKQLYDAKVEMEEQSKMGIQPDALIKPRPKGITISVIKFKPLARKSSGVKGKFKPLKR